MDVMDVPHFGEPADRAHLKRWLSFADDPIWEKVVTRFHKMTNTQPSQMSLVINYRQIIFTAVLARRGAEHAVRTGRDSIHESERAHHRELVNLAAAAECLAKYYAEHLSSHSQQLGRVLQNEAAFFRELAGEAPVPTIRISRQSGGFRLYGAFMSHVIARMRRYAGRPYYPAVVTMTEIAFPDAHVTEDDARSVWRAMAGLRRRPGKAVQSAAD
jgi:hypothetical protein